MTPRIVALIVLLVVARPSASAWQPGAAAGARLRVTDEVMARLVRVGSERSAILRGLIAEIESGDVIVHAERSVFTPRRQTGRLTLQGRAGRFRYVRIAINAALPEDRFIASLAHELQHVREIIAHPHVQDTASLVNLYRRIGDEKLVAGLPEFETDAARRIGGEVRREIANRRTGQIGRPSR